MESSENGLRGDSGPFSVSYSDVSAGSGDDGGDGGGKDNYDFATISTLSNNNDTTTTTTTSQYYNLNGNDVSLMSSS